MNKPFLGLLAAGALLASFPALAQQKAPASAATPAAKAVVVPPGVFVKGQTPGQWLAKDRLIGSQVLNKDGQIIGTIDDLIVNPITNQVSGVILGAGGFLGVGTKQVGVQLSALVFTTKDGKAVLSLPAATKEVLTAVPAFARAEPKKSVTEKAKEKASEIAEKAKDAAAAVKEKAAPLIEKAKDATGKAVEKAKDAVTPAPAAPATPK